MAQDCFYRPGDTKYDLIEDDLGQPVSKEEETSMDSGHKSHKKVLSIRASFAAVVSVVAQMYYFTV